jgi:plasmid stabilization system protein ParE
MSMPVVYLPEALDDVDAAYAAYEQQQVGLGDRFLAALQDRIDQVALNPALYGVFYQDVRAAPVKRFPYVVYYRAESGRVLVVAVQHGGRAASAWQGRI